jgi:two-component system chemotaxis response regulator CheY
MNKNTRTAPITNQDLWQGKRVLIVDDSLQVRNTLKKIYENLGFTIAGMAADGIEALREYSSLKPDLVSLDIIMPNMHGIECYRKLREQDPKVKILLVSRLAKDRQASSSYEREIPEYLFVAKPVDPQVLAESLRTLYSPAAVEASATSPSLQEEAGSNTPTPAASTPSSET